MFTINGERFAEIEGYPGYAISENGKLVSNKNKYKEWREKSPYRGKTSLYWQITLCNKNIRKHFQIHRLVARYFVDGYFEGAVVGHKDANIDNNNYTNLMWITQKENIHQSYKDSGVGPRRHFKRYIIMKNNKEISPVLEGSTEIRNFIEENNLDTSFTSLIRNRHSKDYSLKVL